METNAGRAVIYCRVSTAGQGESGLGLDAQETRCRAYCAAHNLTPERVYREAASGKGLARPVLHAAIGALRPENEPGRAPGMSQGEPRPATLVAFKLDRLIRTASDLEALTQMVLEVGGAWATVEGNYDTSNAMGRFMLRIVADIAQMERELISERTTAALQAKRDRGEKWWRAQFGWIRDTDGLLHPHVEQQKVIEQVKRWRKMGWTHDAIATELRAREVRLNQGGTWRCCTVRKLLGRQNTSEAEYIEQQKTLTAEGMSDMI